MRAGVSIDVDTKRIYAIPVNYEWDEAKRTANLEKHGLDLLLGKRVYEAELKLTIESTRQGASERRFMDVAELAGIVVVLVYTYREEVVRFISLRPAKRKERRLYLAKIENRQA